MIKHRTQQTWMPKKKDMNPRWFLIDAKGRVLGRLAVEAARILRGKHTPRYVPHMDMGDYCVVINARDVHVSGNKKEDKMYFSHSQWRGGLKLTPFEKLIDEHPERVIQRAVKGMLPKGALGSKLMRKLKVYSGPQHPHPTQKLQEVSHGR